MVIKGSIAEVAPSLINMNLITSGSFLRSFSVRDSS